jgi:hypothetical protein
MAGFEPLKDVRDLNATSDDYRPKKWRNSQFESDTPQNRTYNDYATSIYEDSIGRQVEGDNLERSGMKSFHAAPFCPSIESANFNRRWQRGELGHSRLDEIAKAIRTLTYGEMFELAESMWKINSYSEITESDLPGVLHRWSASQRP